MRDFFRFYSFVLQLCFLFFFSSCVRNSEKALIEYKQTTFSKIATEVPISKKMEIAEMLRAEIAMNSSPSISLSECFLLALSDSNTLRISGERIYELQQQYNQAFATLLPTVTLSAGHSIDSAKNESILGQEIAPRKKDMVTLGIRQPLFYAPAHCQLSSLRIVEQLEKLQLMNVREQLLFSVATDFYTILSLERQLEVFASSQKRLDEHLRVLKNKREVGLSSEQEILLVIAKRDQAHARVIQTKYEIKAARARLSKWIGVDLEKCSLQDNFKEASWTSKDVPVLIERASKQRIDVEVATLEIEIAKAKKQAVAAEYLPKVQLDVNRWYKKTWGSQKPFNSTVSVGLSWDLFDSGERYFKMSQAASVIRQKELALQEKYKQIRADVEEAIYAYESLFFSRKAYKSSARAAIANLQQLETKFEAGETTNLDLLVASETLQDSLRALHSSKISNKLALLRLRLCLGEPIFTEELQSIYYNNL